MKLHLKRAAQIRPLDAEVQYWLARISLTRLDEQSITMSEEMDGASAAARIFEYDAKGEKNSSRRRQLSEQAGLAWLLAAKISYELNDYESAHAAAHNAVALLGRR